MSEYYIVANSFAAPVFSDASSGFVEADSPAEALEKYAADYKHPCGLYAAACYEDANAKAKGAEPLARWLSNHVQALEQATEGKGSYSHMGHGPGDFTVDGRRIRVAHPKSGSVVDP